MCRNNFISLVLSDYNKRGKWQREDPGLGSDPRASFHLKSCTLTTLPQVISAEAKIWMNLLYSFDLRWENWNSPSIPSLLCDEFGFQSYNEFIWLVTN